VQDKLISCVVGRVAQWISASDFGSEGRGFESPRGRWDGITFAILDELLSLSTLHLKRMVSYCVNLTIPAGKGCFDVTLVTGRQQFLLFSRMENTEQTYSLIIWLSVHRQRKKKKLGSLSTKPRSSIGKLGS
jgi:hypothetical protein